MSRSYLYVPGDRPDRLVKAAARGADALIVDLEDAVAPTSRESARGEVAEFLGSNPPPAEYWVRINNDSHLGADVAALATAPLAGIYLPKASPQSLVVLDEVLSESGAPLTLPVIALVETAEGVLAARDIARSPRVVQLAIGEADLSAELGVDSDALHTAMTPIRMQLVLASAAAGLDPPTGPVSTQWSDLDALRQSTEGLASMGFGSCAAIHPAQVPVINSVFTPGAEQVARARQLIADYEAAIESGTGVIVDAEGAMVDEAIVRKARRVVASAPPEVSAP